LPTTAAASVTASGAYVTSMPVDVPEYHALQPNLGFEYNSQAGNGLLGMGWQLRGLSEIRATSATGGVATGSMATDKFWLDGNELVRCVNAPTGSRIAESPSCKYAPPAPLAAYTSRIETFRRIAWEPGAAGGRWLVWEKNGTRIAYQRA